MFKKFLSCIVYVLVVYFPGFAQTLKFINYTTKEGLLSDEVYNLYQDQKGYIWIFTNYGTLKYNSMGFKPVLTNLPFNESFIYSAYENSRGEKWVANSNAKIYRIINDSAFLVKGTEQFSKEQRMNVHEISDLFVDDSLNIYATTKRSTYKITADDKQPKQVDLSKQIKHDSIVYKVDEINGSEIATYKFPNEENFSLFCRKGHVWLLFTNKRSSTFYEIDRIAPGGALKHFKRFGKSIYFQFNRFIGKIEEGKRIAYVDLKQTILNFTKDYNGHLWAGCLNGGLYELDGRDTVVNHYLGNTTINDVLADGQSGLWASSPGSGLFHCVNLNDRHFTEDHPLGGAISCLKKVDGALWTGTVKGEIFRIKNGKTELIYKDPDLNETLDIIKFGNDYFFSLKYKCLRVHITGSQCRVITSVRGVVNGLRLFGNDKDSLIYIHRKGIGVIVNNQTKKRIDLNRKMLGCERLNNKLYLATDDGVHSYGASMPPDPSYDEGSYPIVQDSMDRQEFQGITDHAQFKTIVADPHKTLWLCSWGSGLFVAKPNGHIQQYTVKDGLPSNIINDISFNDHNFDLLCTNTGLYWFTGNNNFNPRKLECLYRGDVKHAVAFENKIYIATNKGLIILDREKQLAAENVPFNLASILVNSKEINLQNPLKFKYYENNLEFNFDVISFSDDKTGLIYRLFGPSADSGVVAGHNLKFRNLKPGKYRLVVFPDVQNSRKTRLVFSFTIIPAFWQTTFFYVALCCLIVVLIIAMILLFLRYQKQKAERRTQSEKLILEYKLIALKAQINPHFISNCLTAIQHLIIYNKLEAAADYVAKFGFFVRQILNFSTRSLVSLKEEIGISMLNIELEQLRFDSKFTCNIRLSDNIDAGSLFIPSLILNPIIENAIWHGLLPLRNKRPAELLLSAEIKGHELVLVIEDNGVGRRLNTKNYSNTRESRGIKLIEQRLNNINYLYNITTSRLQYEDLIDEQNEARGTRVTIFLPINLVPLQNE